MRSLSGPGLVALFVLAHAADAAAQWAGAGAVPYGQRYVIAPPAAAYSRPYAFRDESLLSINRSYLGYGNLVDTSGHPPAPGYVTPYGQAVNRGYVPARGGVRWFGRRRGYRY